MTRLPSCPLPISPARAHSRAMPMLLARPHRLVVRRMARGAMLPVWSALLVVPIAGCLGADGQPGVARTAIVTVITGAPDELPSMLNAEPPFRYPLALYSQRVQGNVTLRLYVDSTGSVVADSTRIEESSGHEALDSAALRGAHDLRFNPARRRGKALAVSLLYPVYFRHPEAEPLPEDSVAVRP